MRFLVYFSTLPGPLYHFRVIHAESRIDAEQKAEAILRDNRETFDKLGLKLVSVVEEQTETFEEFAVALREAPLGGLPNYWTTTTLSWDWKSSPTHEELDRVLGPFGVHVYEAVEDE